MDKFFNTAGPVNPKLHYCVDPLARVELARLLSLIEQQKYFVLHAPRQTGKTSSLLALRGFLNARDRFHCVYANVELGQSARGDVGAAMKAILGEVAVRYGQVVERSAPLTEAQGALATHGAHGALNAFLSLLAEQAGRPLVLLLDEVDALVGDTLISLLRQIRAGYDKRPTHFPQSVILCGVRDVRDYRLRTGSGEVITGGSAFNIKAESLRLGDLDRAELEQLYAQHTTATGQGFTPDALALAWELTRGQPWLVNALADETCFRLSEGKDRSRPVTGEWFEAAKEDLIRRRETHLDQLADKLREERVRRVIEPMLAGQTAEGAFRPDDVQYVVDLGLVRRGIDGALSIANRIYQEVVPRELIADTQSGLSQQTAWYVQPDGRLNLPKLLAAFQEFFRENSEAWLERFEYREAGPHLLLQAFLQRIVNSGGRVEREYALGRRRVDLLVRWPYGAAGNRRQQKAVIELKLLHKSRQSTVAEGLEQTVAYAETCGAEEAHLVIFDRRAGVGWDEKVFREEHPHAGRRVVVWGM